MNLRRWSGVGILSVLLACGGGGGDDDGGTTGPPSGNQTLGSITPSTPSMTLDAGTSNGITIVAYDTENAIISNPGTPVFVSQSPSIAEVDASGNVLGVSSGSTTINVSLTRGNVTKTAVVAVTVTGSLPLNADVAASASAYNFAPSAVAIQRGGAVTWTFGSLEHTVTFAGTTGAPASISSGGYSTSISRTFSTAGNFTYQCTIHAGMSGQVVVR